MEASTAFSHEDRKKNGEDLTKISKTIGPMIEDTVMEIIRSYKMELLRGPVDYIVPAVWGAKKSGGLDATQKEIHTQFSPVVDRIIDLFHIKDISEPQKFAIRFLIKSLFISKICYMIDGVKDGIANELGRREETPNILNNVDMIGNA